MRTGGLVYWAGSGKQGLKLRLAVGDGGMRLVEVSQRFPADQPAVFVVHRTYKPTRGRNWTVSHVRSGRSLRTVRTRAQANAIAEAVLPLGDWNKPASRLPRALMDSARAAIKELKV